MKVVINKCYGGFGLSNLAIKEYLKLKGKKAFFYKQTKFKHYCDGIEEYTRMDDITETHLFNLIFTKDFGKTVNTFPKKSWKKIYFSGNDIKRDDPDLIKVVKKLKEKANGPCADLDIVEIPDGIEWAIDEYDGIETIEEKHRTWS